MSNNKERILAIEAHADDVAWTQSGAVALKTPLHQVDSLLYTDSNAQNNGELRLDEQRQMMDILGMTKLYAVGDEQGFRDGHLSSSLYQPMVQALFHILDTAAEERFPYTQIMSFGMDGYTGHPDHMMVASIAEYAFRYRPEIKQLVQVGMSAEEREMWGDYFVYIPETDTSSYSPVDITYTFPKKIEAIQAHKSQLTNGGKEHIARLQSLPRRELYRYKNHA